MTTIINTKLGEHRGKKRVWLEGQRLLREGFEPGMRYDVEVSNEKIVLRVSEVGKFIVSRRLRNGRVYPIIDLKAKELSEAFVGVDVLRVSIRSMSITISVHHQHQKIRSRVDSLQQMLRSGEPLSVCSLFHGGGILDKAIHSGFRRSGIATSISVAVELERKYIESSLTNNPELWTSSSIVIESPIELVDLQRSPPEVHFLFAGIPCTGASQSGISKNKLKFAEQHPSAGAMMFYFLEFVKILNPSVCIIENVTNYLKTASWAVIRSVLDTLGYSIQERVLKGNEFGAIESRNRLCAIAISKGISEFQLGEVKPTKSKEPTIQDILDPLPLDSNCWKEFDYLKEKEERDLASGKGYRRQLLSGSEECCGVVGRGYNKARSTEPFIIHPKNPALSRIFTPVEHCRLKGIPVEVIHRLSDTIAHEVLGQSVVYPAFEDVGAALGKHLAHWATPVDTMKCA